ncbi:hypothetical protein [Vreelandella titanicae]|uniref:hypothetical protein n=1 Tax=Vreelandella titanicae TaxID=664683 RepID=UPI001143E8D0|nr:hypothetical protein [Halomonas titanicae]
MRKNKDATIKINKSFPFFDEDNTAGNEIPEYIIVKSGLKVRVSDAEWVLLQNKGKGNLIKLAWLRSGELSNKEIELALLVFIHYVINKSASTAYTVAIGVRPVIQSGFPSIEDLMIAWSSLGLSKKKATNQFFGTLVRLGYREFAKFHQFTSSNLDSEMIDPLNPFKGRLSELEFDSVIQNLNQEIARIDFSIDRDYDFFAKQANAGFFSFSALRNLVSVRLLIAILRRPFQVTMLKWSDLIPVGNSFNDKLITGCNEILNIGTAALQLRLYRVKSNVKEAWYRSTPERYPMALSEDLSLLMYSYKLIYAKGLSLALLKSGIDLAKEEIIEIMKNMPVFISTDFFCLRFKDVASYKALFTQNSSLYHLGEQTIIQRVKSLKGISDRTSNLSVTSNRLRHTALTRGAEKGLDSAQLSRLTGVTEPAARHYVDLDYQSRRLIDENYLANQFLKNAFAVPVRSLDKNDEVILGSNFEKIGGVKDVKACSQCKTKLGRPIGCYGCPSFRPLLDADHRTVLDQANAKLSANIVHLPSSVKNRSVEKLERQIDKIKITIALCDELINQQDRINDQ